MGKTYRAWTEAYSRFKQRYPQFAKELMQNATKMYRGKRQLPLEDLYKAYQLMSKLVYVDDINVLKDGKIDDLRLCR